MFIRKNPARDKALVSLLVVAIVVSVNCLFVAFLVKKFFPLVEYKYIAMMWVYLYLIGWVVPFGLNNRKRSNREQS
jgi:uncharacterized protein YebE (UPF0316 family)